MAMSRLKLNERINQRVRCIIIYTQSENHGGIASEREPDETELLKYFTTLCVIYTATYATSSFADYVNCIQTVNQFNCRWHRASWHTHTHDVHFHCFTTVTIRTYNNDIHYIKYTHNFDFSDTLFGFSLFLNRSNFIALQQSCFSSFPTCLLSNRNFFFIIKPESLCSFFYLQP